MESVTNTTATEITFVMPTTEALGELKEKTPNFSLTMKYKTADDWAALKDIEVRAYYMGLKGIPNDKGELVTCGVFVSERECFISAPMLLIEAVKQLTPKTPLAITYRGKQSNKNSDGATMHFDVKILG